MDVSYRRSLDRIITNENGIYHGTMQFLLYGKMKYSEERIAFGKPIAEFGQIQKYVSDSYAKYMAGRSYLYNVSNNMDLSKPGNRLDTDGVKLFTTTMGKEVADNAIQVLGGYGYCGEYQVEQLWRDAKLLEIGGGTLESHQKNMARDLRKGVPENK